MCANPLRVYAWGHEKPAETDAAAPRRLVCNEQAAGPGRTRRGVTFFFRRWPRRSAYVFAVSATLLTLALRMAMAVPFGNRPLLILFMLPIILSALIGGLGPGVLSTAVAALGINLLAIPPVGNLEISAGHDLAQWFMLVLCGVLVSILSERLHRVVKTLHASQERAEKLFHCSAVPLCLVDRGGTFLDSNDRFVQLFGDPRADTPTLREWWARVCPGPEGRNQAEETWDADVRRADAEGKDTEPREYRLSCADGASRTLVISGRRLGENLLISFFDVTARKVAEESTRRALAAQTTLLQEVHHRVKNNLQIISSLLNLQADRIQEPAARDVLVLSVNRVRSMARVHEMLYSGRDLARIDLGVYLRSLLSDLSGMFNDVARTVTVEADLASVPIPVDKAVPCALIANELVTNVYKHAFAGGGPGTLRVRLGRKDGDVEFVVSDDGAGLPEGFDPAACESLGFQLVFALVEQLGGKLDISSEGGTTFRISFPCAAAGRREGASQAAACAAQ